MRRLLVFVGLLVGSALTATDASAVVCARGIYRAGCVGVGGSVVTRGVVYPRRTVVVRRGYPVRRTVYRGRRF
jgi:hypothetical protein